MAEFFTPKPPSKHERHLLRAICKNRYFRVKHGYRGTGTNLIKICTARTLKRQGLAREAMTKTNRGSFPYLEITGLGQDLLENRVQGNLFHPSRN